MVRDDGRPDPELRLDPDALPDRPVNDPGVDAQPSSIVDEIDTLAGSAPTATGDAVPGSGDSLLNGSTAGDAGSDSDDVHPVRQRLLARAAAAQRGPDPSRPAPGLAELELPPQRGRASVERALDHVGADAARPRSAPHPSRSRGPLTPNMIAVVGTLLGLVTISSIVALGIRLDPTLHPAPEPSGSSDAVVPAARAPSPLQMKRRERKRIPGPWRVRDAKGQGGAKIITGTVGRSPFLKAVQDAGVPKKQAYRVLTAMKGLRDFDRCQRSDRFAALLDPTSQRLTAFEYIVSAEEVYQAKEGDSGLLVAQRLDLKVAREQVSGAVAMRTGDLSEATALAGFESGLATVLRKALHGHLALEDIKQGDTVRVIAQEVTVLGEFARYAGIEALEYRAADGSKPLRIYYFQGPESRGYYDAEGRSPYEGGWRRPIPNAPITSPFDLKRMHPVVKKVMPHYGTDFGAPSGTPVGASSFGRVSFVGYSGPAGNLVKIEHTGSIETGYAHLSRFADGLKVGDRVKRMQVIGYVGSTGRSTGPHLHFSAKKDGKFFDPVDLKLDAMRVLPKAERSAFQQVKADYDRRLDAIELPQVAPAEPIAQAEAADPDPEPDLVVDAPVGVGAGSDGPPPAPDPTPAAPANPAAAGNPVYLTDKELLEMQPGTDDGEVAE